MTRWSLFLQTLSLLHHFLGLYYAGVEEAGRPQPHYDRGYGWLFERHILQADQGCDFDFLRAEGV